MTALLPQIRTFGRDFTPEQIEKTLALYAPHAPRAATDLCAAARDLRYGPDARNRLDVFTPTAAVKGAPVALFVSGGGFVRGDKGEPDAVFYNNFGAWACRQGFIGVTMNYRHAPEHTWPAGARDVAAAIHWLRENILRFGGDPEHIVAVGQSAGGSHVATYLAHLDLREESEANLAGAALISGIFDPEIADEKYQNAYFGTDAANWPMQSSVSGLAQTDVPLLLTVSEYDPPEFHRHAAAAVAARAEEKHEWPRVLWLAGHNHISPVAQLGVDDDTLGPALADFIRAPKAD